MMLFFQMRWVMLNNTECHSSIQGVGDQVTLGFSIPCLGFWWNLTFAVGGTQIWQLKVRSSCLRFPCSEWWTWGSPATFHQGCAHTKLPRTKWWFRLSVNRRHPLCWGQRRSVWQKFHSACWMYTLTCFLNSGFEVIYCTGEFFRS